MAKCYPGGKAKAFNLTYDDGVLQDERLVSLLNRYGVRATFNLNSQLMQERFTWTHPTGMPVTRLSPEAARRIYDVGGHEVASHTLTHPCMQSLTDEELYRQLRDDKANLEALFGREVRGFAVPFDHYDDRIADCARRCGFAYTRTSDVTADFTPNTDPFRWKAGLFHLDPRLTDYVASFLNTQEELAVCQIVGHSYDLDAENLWGTLELICAAVSARDDVWLCTNAELADFLTTRP